MWSIWLNVLDKFTFFIECTNKIRDKIRWYFVSSWEGTKQNKMNFVLRRERLHLDDKNVKIIQKFMKHDHRSRLLNPLVWRILQNLFTGIESHLFTHKGPFRWILALGVLMRYLQADYQKYRLQGSSQVCTMA